MRFVGQGESKTTSRVATCCNPVVLSKCSENVFVCPCVCCKSLCVFLLDKISFNSLTRHTHTPKTNDHKTRDSPVRLAKSIHTIYIYSI